MLGQLRRVRRVDEAAGDVAEEVDAVACCCIGQPRRAEMFDRLHARQFSSGDAHVYAAAPAYDVIHGLVVLDRALDELNLAEELGKDLFSALRVAHQQPDLEPGFDQSSYDGPADQSGPTHNRDA